MVGMRILVIHASRDGQTARIADRMGTVLRGRGHEVRVLEHRSSEVAAELARADAVVIGGGVRYGRHLASLDALVRRHFAAIVMRPNAFFSVSLSAGAPGARPEAQARLVEAFLDRVAWKPDRVASFAGALLYTRYNPFIRLMMRFIVGQAGGDTDTSRDYEYTDWPAVEGFALECATSVTASAARFAAD